MEGKSGSRMQEAPKQEARKRKLQNSITEAGPSKLRKLRKSAADISNRQAYNRGQVAWKLLEELALAGHEETDKAVSLPKLLSQMFKQRAELIRTVADQTDMCLTPLLTASETVAMQQKCQLSFRGMRNMRAGLNQKKANSMASERQVRNFISGIFDRSSVEVMSRDFKISGDQVAKRVVIRAKELLTCIKEVIGQKKIDPAKTPAQLENKYIILLSGDKGGTSTKLYFSIPNLKLERDDQYSTHMYAFIEATEDYDNLKTAWSDYYREEVIKFNIQYN